MTKGASLVPLPFGRLKGPRRDHDSTTYQLIEGDELRLLHHGDEIALTAAAPTVSRRRPRRPRRSPAPGTTGRPSRHTRALSSSDRDLGQARDHRISTASGVNAARDEKGTDAV